MKKNAAGLYVEGSKNPNWKGGLLQKFCLICKKEYFTKQAHSKSKFCSLQCVGIYNKGKPIIKKKIQRVYKKCEYCGDIFNIPKSHQNRSHCCSKDCSYKNRSINMRNHKNHNWMGGVSRLPYPHNFNEISKKIIQKFNFKCQGYDCSGADKRMTTHHIDYDKQNCDDSNLICLCSSCNTKANFNRDFYKNYYRKKIQEF